MAEPPGFTLYRFAAACEKFRCLPHELAGLTDAQIDRVLFHPRDKDGALVQPAPPPGPPREPTRANKLADIESLRANGLISDRRAAELVDEVNRGEVG